MNNNVMMINVNTRKQSNTAQFQLEKRKMPAFILCSRQSRLQLRLGPPKKPGLGENRNGKNFLGDTCVSSFAPAGALPFVSGRGPPSFSVKDQRVTIFDPRGPLYPCRISLPFLGLCLQSFPTVLCRGWIKQAQGWVWPLGCGLPPPDLKDGEKKGRPQKRWCHKRVPRHATPDHKSAS